MEGSVDKISLIAKRDFERKQDIQKRKDDRSSHSADNEKLAYFEETFVLKRTNIEELLTKCREFEKNALPDHLNSISKEILLLQKYVAASNIFLRTYDIKKCQEAIQELTNMAKELEEELLPKKKFGFKNKSKPRPSEKKLSKDEPDCNKHEPATIITKEICGFINKSGEELLMQREEIFKKDITAENLNNCTVRLLGSPSTLHLNNLANSFVFSGPVSTSIFAENCTNCTLVIACQQLRLHSSKNVKIYLHVTSRAIMEDCHEIFVTPYNLIYKGLEQDFEDSGLDKSANNWQSLDDFNWLNIERQSPNWSILPNENAVNKFEILL